jgi:hypothetical protein
VIDPALRLWFFSQRWIDRWCLFLLARVFMGGRAWAAAIAAKGNPDDFSKWLGLTRQEGGLGNYHYLLRQTWDKHQAACIAQQDWAQTVFGGTGDVAHAERNRRQSAHADWMQRFSFVNLARWNGVQPVTRRQAVPSEAVFARWMGNPFRESKPLLDIAVSRAWEKDSIREYWLRYGENGYARVLEPFALRSDTPTFVYAHGLAMETEMLSLPFDPYAAWARAGMRVILPDGPGHNRRVADGFYGGENFLMAPPLSAVEYFLTFTHELASLIAWARGRGPVALGGISLGALSSQLLAQYCDAWPNLARPDALLLVTTTAFISRLHKESAIAKVTGLDNVMAPWRPEELARLGEWTDALTPPAMDPGRVHVLLGKYDKVTPYAGGKALLENWRLPRRNVTLRRQGHFSAAFGFQRNWNPLRKMFRDLGSMIE